MSSESKEAIRVLHLVRSMHVGGLEMVVLNLCKGLREEGITSCLGCLLDAGEWAEHAEVARRWEGKRDQKGALATLLSLMKFIRREKISLIHTHNSHPHKYGVVASLVTGVPLVHTKHGRNWPDNPKWVWFSRQLSRFTKVIVPVSREIESIVVDIEKVPAKKTITILNGVDAERFTPLASREQERMALRAERSIPANAFVVGSVGRLSVEKCYPLLVEAFAGLIKEHPDACLVIVGEGSERPQIEAAARECGIAEHCLFPGVRSDVVDWLRCFDLFCLSSDQEGTSVTLIEAGMCELPAVVTDVGGNAEIVADGETGCVVNDGNVSEMTEAMCRLVANRDERVGMGVAARKRMVDRYGCEAMVRAYIEAYRCAGVSNE